MNCSKYYRQALTISTEKFENKQFEDLPKNFSQEINNIALPWLIDNILCYMCPRISGDKDDIANFIYLFVALFNCMKRLLGMYIKSNPLPDNLDADDFESLVKILTVSAYTLSFKSLGLDDLEPCKRYYKEFRKKIFLERHERWPATKQIKYFVEQTGLDASGINKIEDEMFKLSDYKGCIAEHMEMIKYLEKQ